MDFDLDLIAGKKHTLKINGKVYEFKDLTVEDSMLAEFEAKEIDDYPLKSKEDIKKLKDKVANYVVLIIDIEQEEAEKVTLNGYKGIRKLLGRMDLYDQGFTDREIDKMEKEVVKGKLFQKEE